MKLNKPYPFDVDDTLIKFDDFDKSSDGIDFKDPNNGEVLIVKPIEGNLNLLKKKYEEGFQIILWSQSGADYAEEVAKILGVFEMVSVFMDKPKEYCDDLPASAWMNQIFKE